MTTEFQHLEPDVGIHGRGILSTVPWGRCHDAGLDAVHAGRPFFIAGSDAVNSWRLILETGSDATNLCEPILQAGRDARDSGEHYIRTIS